jgi:hypothetical protein
MSFGVAPGMAVALWDAYDTWDAGRCRQVQAGTGLSLSYWISSTVITVTSSDYLFHITFSSFIPD